MDVRLAGRATSLKSRADVVHPVNKAVWAALLCAAVTLSGCLGGDADDDNADSRSGENGADGNTSPATPEDDAVDPSAVPEWMVGDWWDYSVDYASGESFSARFVVHAEDSGQYFVTADSRDLLVRAEFTHYPTFGAVAKGNLAQQIHDDSVRYLRFPMEAGNWSAPFRDFSGEYSTVAATLSTGQGPVDGFVTTMRNADDGLQRLAHGYSHETKWFTNFTFDFDGVPPADVSFELQDWGTNHTGPVPVVDMVEKVHRPFTGMSVPTPDPASPPAAPAPPADWHETITVDDAESSLVVGLFAGSGGAGRFSLNVGPASEPNTGIALEWQPSAPSGVFVYEELAPSPTGDLEVIGTAVAQGFAFLFGEVYEARTTEVVL